MSDKGCPFCGEPATYASHTAVHFRCGTSGPDINGEYDVGHTCDITFWTRLLRDKDAEIRRLTKEREEARDAAMWLRIVLTNQTQGEFMAGVYQRWPWLETPDEA